MENQKFNNLINENENRNNIKRKIFLFLGALTLILIGILFKIFFGGLPDKVTPVYGIIGTINNDTIKIKELRQNPNEIKNYKE
jgi:hypothetical protein